MDGWEENGQEEEEEDVIDEEEGEELHTNEPDIDLQVINKHPDFERCLKILEELKQKYP